MASIAAPLQILGVLASFFAALLTLFDMQHPLMTIRRPAQQRIAVRFFQLAILVFALAAALAWLLTRIIPPPPLQQSPHFPTAFWFSSLLLLVGSLLLHRATWDVRRERQTSFRRGLIAALCTGGLFLGVQSYGLICLLQQQQATQVATGVTAFVFVFAFLHGLHFVVATLFLVFVTVRARADRYDHEYYWGVLVCGYFWHALGVVWLAILFVFAIVT